MSKGMLPLGVLEPWVVVRTRLGLGIPQAGSLPSKHLSPGHLGRAPTVSPLGSVARSYHSPLGGPLQSLHLEG